MEEDLEEVVEIPARADALVLQPELGRVLVLEQVEDDVAQDGKIVWGVICAHTGLILTNSFAVSRVVRRAPRFPIHGDRLPVAACEDRLHPTQKTGLKLLGIQPPKDAVESVVRRDLVLCTLN